MRGERWEPAIEAGAVRDGERLFVHLNMPGRRRMQFDFARHRRVLNFAGNYVRLNEFRNGSRSTKTVFTG